MAPDERSEKQAAAQQAVDILHEISTILVGFTGGGPTCKTMRGSRFTDRAWSPPPQNCHLDRRTLSICISMIENGVNPEALAVSSFVHLRKPRHAPS